MKTDFNHNNPTVDAFLKVFRSPEVEASLLKGVPLPLLDSVKRLVKEVFPNKRLRVKYRGPRQSVGSVSGTCRRRDAKSAAIYFKEY